MSQAAAKNQVIDQFFTENELQILKRDRYYGQMMDFSNVDKTALATISMKSIVLARYERQGLDSLPTEEELVQIMEAYPVTARGRASQGASPVKTDTHLPTVGVSQLPSVSLSTSSLHEKNSSLHGSQVDVASLTTPDTSEYVSLLLFLCLAAD